jgi:xylulose-5-phosphate/fructose-6-phosphate phosphoketolase
MAGPGHGAPGVPGPVHLEATYSEIYPIKSEDEEGMRAFFKDFSFPGGIGSHCTPENWSAGVSCGRKPRAERFR